jgi:glycyl-tRNA synthetase (class II)
MCFLSETAKVLPALHCSSINTSTVCTCTTCRADKALKSYAEKVMSSQRKSDKDHHAAAEAVLSTLASSAPTLDGLHSMITSLGMPCPNCGAGGATGLARPRMFNLLFQTHVGPVMPEDALLKPAATGEKVVNPNQVSHAYLRPETAQGVYVNYLNVMNSSRRKLPLGIGQVGKSFRNEVAVGNFVFRSREFDQMELQYFCDPDDSTSWYVMLTAHGENAQLD